MRVIVGLGNPGKEYRETRHNVGFMVADELARRHDLQWRADTDAMYAKKFGEPAFFVLKPMTFMNRSGFAVSAFAARGWHTGAELPAGFVRGPVVDLLQESKAANPQYAALTRCVQLTVRDAVSDLNGYSGGTRYTT